MKTRAITAFICIQSVWPVAWSQNLPCELFPPDNAWNTPVDHLPVHSRSDAYVESIGADTNLHPDFGTVFEGAPNGIPYVVVPQDQPNADVSFVFDDESDPGGYPIPAEPPIEAGPDSTGDRHVLIVVEEDCLLYELFDAHPLEDGSWMAGSGAVFDLNSNMLRPDTWTSADAAGLPILPGLVRYEEAAAGEINHALRFTASRTQRDYVWPARHFASSIEDANVPPMGQRFRLKADFDISGFSPVVQTILQAMKTYGIILADNGSDWFISGAPSSMWDDDMLRELRQVHGRDFEAVDVSSMIVDPDSGQAVQPAGGEGEGEGEGEEERPRCNAAASTRTKLPPPSAAGDFLFLGLCATILLCFRWSSAGP